MKRLWFVTILVVTVVVLAGCSKEAAATSPENTYTSKVLNASYPNALSVPDQLSLGTLRLEGTEQAISAEQAKALLPLWQAIQAGTFTLTAEQNAVYAQIEAQLSPAQLGAIAALELTEQDLQVQNTRPDTPPDMPAGGERGSLENTSGEQRVAMRPSAQLDGKPAGDLSGVGASQTRFVLGSLIMQLSMRASSGADPAEEIAQPPAEAPAAEPAQAQSAQAAVADTPNTTQATLPAAEAAQAPTTEVDETSGEAPIAEPAQAPALVTNGDVEAPVAEPAQTPTLTRLEDTDPAPPLTVLVNSIRIEQDGTYKLSGTVRNDSSENYGGVSVIATFYSVQTLQGKQTQIPHGPVDVSCPYLLLEPGEECPFSIEMYARDYVAYHLHAEGRPAGYRQPAELVLSGLSVSNDGVGSLRITGTAVNQNSYAVKDATIAGTLLETSDQVISVGSTVVPGQIPAGASVSFDLRIEYAPYSRYQLYAQATQS
jgi:hypothetical protein